MGDDYSTSAGVPTNDEPPPAPRRRIPITTSKPSVPRPQPLPNGTSSTPRPPPPPPLDLPKSLSYTSLRDLLPTTAASAASNSAMNSPTAAASSSYEIAIRNRLLKQAAWAYLRPMSSSPASSGTNLLGRLCLRLSSCLQFLRCLIARVLRCFLSVPSHLR